MIYDISLSISYEYGSRADAGRHTLRLLPAIIQGEQRLILGALHPEPHPDERRDRTDFFGNNVTEVAYRAPLSKIAFNVQARIDRMAAPVGLDISPPLRILPTEISQVRSMSPDQPVHFLGASPRIVSDLLFHDYALQHTHSDMTVLSAVEAIGKALYDDMAFDAEATTVETAALEAFENRHGVCQDFTHIMISCLRSIGIPAGYVSGFLRTLPPEGMDRLEGADAMHAWVRAWCGVEIGWVEYDPTNALRVGSDHIVVARGRDYSDIAPVKGVLRTSGSQTTKQSVDVVPR
ncbi:transglutaminase-like putative cysteine protease [Roseibium hamelinense]|uniref:Transglutaminase-like putative cysteine protease n=1 Tax=Roseibium hamelinense TaxID=150831 RepID=A0A562SXJ9_9HYPH|nr:transglutaminase family protein [Roseibium hamelinense]MTI44772.1 transglutaminase family protein [Roseibium hamelinense]TWI86039.1 transglutaminase-like putative cysteine protease [Roseibium hamelinense]